MATTISVDAYLTSVVNNINPGAANLNTFQGNKELTKFLNDANCMNLIITLDKVCFEKRKSCLSKTLPNL